MDQAVQVRSDDDIPPGFHPYYRDDLFYHSVGPMYVRYMGGKMTFGLRVAEKHCNAAMIAHGGVLATLMDMQVGVSSCVELDVTAFVPTVNLTCDFLAPAKIGDWVEAHSKVVHRTKRMIFSHGVLEVDGKAILRGNGIVKIPSTTDLPDEFAKMVPPEYVPEE